jgi:hypothetical protein
MNLTQLERVLTENKPLYIDVQLNDKEFYNRIAIQCDELGNKAIVLLTKDQILMVADNIQLVNKSQGVSTMRWDGTGIMLENNKYIHIFERDLIYDMLSGYKNAVQSKQALKGKDKPLTKPWVADIKKKKLALAPTGKEKVAMIEYDPDWNEGYYYNLI